MDVGQFAINTNDGKVFIKKSDNTVKDITDNIFRNDSSVVITDSVDGSFANLDTGAITSTVDGVNISTLKKTQIELKEKVHIENEKELRFYENFSSGTQYVSFKASNDLGGTYNLTLPTAAATKPGQLLGVDAGQLNWYDADTFGGNRIYVSAEKGNDTNDGINAPVKTIKRALQLASEKVYDGFGVPNGARWNVAVAAGEYYENNPIIVPDNVSVIGDGLRACILRPQNANKDMLRVRNGCYFTEFTFRDALTGAPSNPSPIGSPIYTFDYCVAFDDPLDISVSRVGYTNLPTTKPIITTSPYIQNCSIISFLGGNGVLVDGSKVVSPNTPTNQIEAENPISGPAPEQGKSMVANAFTMLSFGGTGWRVINDAYVQIVSCFQIFMLNGTYTQSGGYCSITNSATNFGLYALRASGFSPNAFAFDKGYVATTGTNDSKQTITAFGWTRPEGPVEEFIVRIYDPSTNADLTDNTYKLVTAGFAEKSFNAATAVNTTTDEFTINTHGFTNGNQVTYFVDGGTAIGGMFNGDTYFVSVIDANTFRLAFDDSFTRFLDITSAGVGTQRFRRNDYEMIVNDVLESHNTFQTIVLTANAETFTAGDLITGDDTAPPGNPHSAYVYTYNPITYEMVVVINKVTVGVTQQRVSFNSTSRILSKNGVTLGTPITINSGAPTPVAARTDLWAATFEIIPTTTGGQFTGLASLPGKKIWFHRPSITNSSAHTWEYAGSGIDYNALPQNGGKTVEKYEQYDELAGKVYTSGTNELGDFKVGDFIRAFNRTGNVVFNNKVSIDQLDVLRLALSDVEITAISTDPDLGENEDGGPLDSRLSTQKSIWSYANNRLGPFIDKSVSTNAVPGNIVQLNANGQINRDLIPSQRNFNSFTTLGFGTRITLAENIPVDDSQSGDICTERYQEVPLVLDNPITASEGWLVTQAGSGATGYITETVTGSTNISVASIYGTFETPNFNTTGALTINGDATPSDTNGAVIPAVVGTIVNSTSNYFISSSTDSQYLIVGNTSTFTYTNVAASTAVRFNNVAYVETAASHSLFTGNRVQLDFTADDFDKVDYITVFDTTRFSVPNLGTNTTITGSTTATATINAVTGTSTTGSCTDASLTGTIATGDWVFGGGLPLGSRITAVNLSGDPNTFTVTFPSSTTVAGTTTAALTFITPVAQTGTVKTVITAADSLSSGAFDEFRSGVLTSVNNLSFTPGSGYTPAVGTATYLRVPLTNVSGSGTGATANITVANGSVTDVDIFRGGSGYQSGNVLSALAANIGGTGSGFQILVTGVEQRIYLDIIGGQLFVATTGAIDFIEDNNSPNSTITATSSTTKSFNALPVGSAGDVDYATNRITITSHGFANGDPVKYDPAPNIAMGGLGTGSVYYVKSINANTIELYQDYNLATQMNFGTSSTGTHNLIRYAVNLVDNSFYVPGHGFATGDAVRMSGTDLPSYLVGSTTTQISNNSYFFVGSITTNSFTLHDLRSDALASINGLVTAPYDITVTGTGLITFVDNDITITGVVNTSSQYLDNWSVLVADNIDASNIISGIISTSRLALGTANSDTFLRGDSTWKPVVQTVEYVDGTVDLNIKTDTLFTVLGSVNPNTYGTYDTNDKAGNVNFDIQRVDQQTGDYSKIGVASFLKEHFVVGDSATTLGGSPAAITTTPNGRVYIRPSNQGGTVDAATLETQNLSYVLNSGNHTTQPVNKGGTNIISYTTGDMIYATGTTVLDKLPINVADTVLTSTGSAPQWSPGLTLARNISVASGELTTASTASGTLFNTNVVDVKIGSAATSVKIGSQSNQTLTSNVVNYTTSGASSVSVTANLTGSVAINTASLTNSGATQIDLSNTTGVKIGQILSGSGSLAANTLVVGISATRVYINNATVGSISSATSLTFSETNTSLGLSIGDQVTISGESGGSANLNGTWPITSAGATNTAFIFKINAAVTLTNAARAGSITKITSLLIRNSNVTIGGSEAGTSPVAAVIKAENGVGTNISGAALTIRPGLSSGNATGGVINFATGTTGSTGDVQQSAVTRMSVEQSAAATTLNLTTAMITANVFNTAATTVNAFGDATSLNIGNATSATVTLRPGTLVGSNVTQAVYNTVAETVNAFGAATAVNIGASTGTLTTRNPTIVGTQTTQNVYNTVAETINFGGAATVIEIGAATGTTNVNNNLDVDGDVNIDGGDLTVSTTSFNLINTTAETVNAFGAATAINIGANSGTLTIRNTTVVGTEVTQNIYNTVATTVNAFGAATAVNIGANTGTLTTRNPTLVGTQTTQNVYNTVAETINFGGAATDIQIGAATGTTNVNNNLVVDLDLEIKGEDLTVTTPTFNLANATATTVNAFGAATGINIGASGGSGILTIKNDSVVLDGDLAVNGGDITTTATTANLFNATAATINFGGAATDIQIGAATGTTNVNNNLDVDGDVNIDGGDLTVSTATFNLANATATTVNAFGVATAVNVGISAAAASTLVFGPAITGNIVEINSTAAGTVTVRSDVTTGTVNLFTGTTTGTTNISTGGAGTINLGNTSATTRVGVLNVQNRAYTTTNSTASITSSAAIVIDTFAVATFRSGEYTMQVTCTAGTNINTYQISKVLVIHDGTTSTLTEYGLIKTGAAELATFTTNINGLNVEILAQASTGNTVTVQLTRTLQTV